jgi:gelsolin
MCSLVLQILEGGYASGFRRVKPEEYKPRLLWVRKEQTQIISSEVPLGLSSLNSGDCFILDSGAKLFIFR